MAERAWGKFKWGTQSPMCPSLLLLLLLLLALSQPYILFTRDSSYTEIRIPRGGKKIRPPVLRFLCPCVLTTELFASFDANSQGSDLIAPEHTSSGY